MKFRTEIEIPRQTFNISHSDKILMLGSCFTDNIGEILQQSGFDVSHNILGALYNPASISSALQLAFDRDFIIVDQNVNLDSPAIKHCLNFSNRYQANNEVDLFKLVDKDLDILIEYINNSDIAIITLGTAFVFKYLLLSHKPIVGNCHKLPSNNFSRELLSLDFCVKCLTNIVKALPNARHIIFTVSPIRHTSDGLHGNQISKSTLLLAINQIVDEKRIHYFPAYEIVLDDLRDYRFYSDDLKHPSNQAVEYIFEIFSKYYFNKETSEIAATKRKEHKRSQHRPII